MPFPATANPNALNGLKISEVNSPTPATRLFFSYDYFRDGPDLNRDRIADILFGLPGADTPGGNASGRVLVLGLLNYGAQPATIDLATFIPPQDQGDPLLQSFFALNGYGGGTNFSAGVSVAAGDVNGDGFADIVTGANGAGGGSGSTYVFFAPAAAPTQDIPLGNLDGTDGFRIDFGASFQGGVTVATADIDDDGFADIITGTPGRNGGAGGITVVRGGAGPFNPVFASSQVDGSNGFDITGFGAGDGAGGSGIAVGDFNGDGIDDIAVSRRFADPNGRLDAGTVNVILGDANGFPATFDVNTLNGSNGFSVIGGFAGQQLGWSLSTAGDFDGDGLTDLIIGAPPTNNFAGAAIVIFGDSGPFPPVIDVGALSPSDGFIINGILQNDSTGVSVGGGFDANGDGFADVVIGAADTDGPNAAFDAGSAFVVFGGPNRPASPLNLTSLDGNNGFRFDFLDPGFRNGIYVSASDVDADGLGDVFVGNQANGNGTFIYGMAPDAAVTRNGSAAAQTIFGSPFGDHLNGEGGNDVLNGRGGDDILNGGLGNDAGILDSSGDLFDGGDGTDTAVVLGLRNSFNDEFILDVRNAEVVLVPSLSDPRFSVPPSTFDLEEFEFRMSIPNVSVPFANRLELVATELQQNEGLQVNAEEVSDGGVWVFAGAGLNQHVGGAGQDAVLHSIPGNYVAGNTFDGGDGIDSLGFRGNFIGPNAVALQDNSLSGVEVLVALSGLENPFGGLIVPGGFQYEFTLAAGNVPVNGQLDVVGTSLGATETLTVDGSLVTGSLRFFGGDGSDTLTGGSLADLFFGGLGGDTLNGGPGANRYVYLDVAESTPVDPDLMIWNNGDGSDVVDLQRVDADTTQDGDQNFTFIGANAFSNTPGELRALQIAGNNWQAFVDVNGDGVADMCILIETPAPLTAAMFDG